jgi:hypothetical protein
MFANSFYVLLAAASHRADTNLAEQDRIMWPV